MKALQLTGLILAILALGFGYALLYLIEPNSSYSSASAVGLTLTAIVIPMLVISALMIVPTSIALLFKSTRKRVGMSGVFWISVWSINSLLTIIYLGCVSYLAYLWLSL